MRQPPNTHLAQLNVATAIDDVESARLADFMAALDRVNAVAERSPGFVWRLKDDQGNSTSIKVSDDPRFIVNLSVWERPEDLEHYVWNTVHKQVYAKRENWFEKPEKPYFVMWWIPAGHIPTPEEAMERLADLQENGPSDRAFGWEALPNVQLWKKQRCA